MKDSLIKLLPEFKYIEEDNAFIGEFEGQKTIISLGEKLTDERLNTIYNGYLLYGIRILDNKYDAMFFGKIIGQEKKCTISCLTEANVRSKKLSEYLNRYILKATIYVYCPMQEWSNANHGGNGNYKGKTFDIYNLSDLIEVCESKNKHNISAPVFIYTINKKYRMSPNEILNYIKEHKHNWDSDNLRNIINKLNGEI